MKFIKKLFSLTMTVAMMVMMLATFGTPIKAADDGSITIENPKVGETYSIYKILDYDGSQYTLNETWKEFFETDEATAYVNVVGNVVTWGKDVDVNKVTEFVEYAYQYATAHNIEPDRSLTCGDDKKVEFKNLPLGYYMVGSNNRSLLALDTTKKHVLINEKDELPNIDKQVEDSTGNFGDSNTAEIGDTVNFKVTITAEHGAKNYVYHDVMSDGLTFDVNSVAVYWVKEKDQDHPILLTVGNEYTFESADKIEDGCKFELIFISSFLDKLEDYDTIEITYSATINENAVIVGDEGENLNKAGLSYGENGRVEDTTITKVFGLDIFKYTKEGEEKKELSGAEFVLYRDVKTENETGEEVITGRKYLIVKKNNEGIYKVVGWTGTFEKNEAGSFDFPTQSSTATETSYLISGDDGYIHVEGLDAGEYHLLETKAPEGYNPINDAYSVKIDKDAITTKVIEVENNKGTELPSTGGIGTTIFYVIGGLLMVGAVVLLVTKKKMSVNDDK